MHLRLLYNIIVVLLVNLAFISCNKVDDIIVAPQPVEVVLRASHAEATRTEMGNIGEGSAGSNQSIKWSVGDRIMVWAKEQGVTSYTLDKQIFTLSTYNSTYNDADFLSTLASPMDTDKTYDYYGLYPEPTTVTVNPQNPGSRYVSYTLPTTQSGAYDSNLDVMLASGSGRGMYERGESPDYVGAVPSPTLSFRHLFHLIRIRIPDGRNYLGQPIKRFEFTFPQAVVGTVSFDATDPNGEIRWTNTSNKLSVVIDDNNLLDDDGNSYVWLHIMPTTLNGEVTFAAYTASGVKSHDKTFSISRELQAEHITPLALEIPRPYRPVVYIDLVESATHLGEPWTSMTLTGFNFVDQATSGQTTSLTITPNNKRIAIYPDVDGDNNALMSSVNGKSLTVTYESEHALLTGKTISLPDNLKPTTEYNTPINTANYTVPYLLEENFSRVENKDNYKHQGSTNQGDDNGVDLSSVGLSVDSGQQPWSSSGRYVTSAGKAIRICNRAENVWVLTQWKSTSNGRFDSTNIKGIKDTAKLRLEFNYSMSREASKSSASTYYLAVGAHSETGTIAAASEGVSTSSPSVTMTLSEPCYADLNTGNLDGTFDKINSSFNQVFEGCTSSTRFAWEVYIREFTPDGYYTHWVYIDNIRVSIAQ